VMFRRWKGFVQLPSRSRVEKHRKKSSIWDAGSLYVGLDAMPQVVGSLSQGIARYLATWLGCDVTSHSPIEHPR